MGRWAATVSRVYRAPFDILLSSRRGSENFCCGTHQSMSKLGSRFWLATATELAPAPVPVLVLGRAVSSPDDSTPGMGERKPERHNETRTNF